MENHTSCLICRRTTLKNSSEESQKLVTNASLLQDFLNCFHINVLDSQVIDLSTSCQFCPPCEQFIAEWSSIQTQTAQLTRRAAQLKATLSALLLSAPGIQNHDDDVAQIINNRIPNSQEVELPLLLQQTIDDIRNKLRKKYSVNVVLDKIQLPFTKSKMWNQEELDPLVDDCGDNDDEPMDDWRGDDNSDPEYLPCQVQMDDEETSEQIFKTDDEGSPNDSDGQDSVELKHMKVNRKSKTQTKVGRKSRARGVPKRETRKLCPSNRNQVIPDGPNKFKFKGMSFTQNEEDQTYTCDTCGFKSLPQLRYIKRHIQRRHLSKPAPAVEKEPRKQSKPTVIPDGPNAFKYNGHGLKLNGEDQCYYCGACDFKGTTKIHSLLIHIRDRHYTQEDKIKFTPVKINDTEWLYGGKFKIIRVGQKFKCVSCGCENLHIGCLSKHIRKQHVDVEGHQEVVPLPVTDTPPTTTVSTPTQGVYKSVPYTFNPISNKYGCGICQKEVWATKKYLNVHIRERHTDAAPSVICEICGKELSNQRVYQEHLRRHQNEIHTCPTCNKKYACPRRLKLHMKVHILGEEGAKKFQCEYCGKKFFTSDHFRRHVAVTHNGEDWYECRVCGEKFSNAAKLTDHRYVAHGIERQASRLIRVNE